MKASFGKYFMGDRAIWVVYFFLCAISLVEVFSAGSALAYKSGSFLSPLLKQAFFIAFGTLVLWLLHRVPCRVFKVLPIFLWPVSVALLLITLLFAEKTNDGSRWMDIGLFRFQPSEVAKLTVVVAVALILSRMQRENGADRRALRYILLVTLPVVGLIFPENLSTAGLLAIVVFLMMFIGRVPLVQLGKVVGVCALTGTLFLGTFFALRAMGQEKLITGNRALHRLDTWVSRVETHAGDGREDDPAAFDLENDAQIAHANIAIASCNGVGKLPGNSVERDFLSQAFSDFIYAIIIEEMGVAGCVLVPFFYIVILIRVGRVASRCERNFPPFLALGLALMLVSQALVNTLVAVGLIPVTGQPLPLISRGGTSTVISCAYIGMILSVSRYARSNPKPERTRFSGSLEGVCHEEERPKEA